MHIDDHTLSQAAYLVQYHTGLRSPESNRSHLKRILLRMCKNRGISISSIIPQIKKDKDFLQEFLNEAMIGETYFFREVSHFRVLLNHVFAEIGKRDDNIRMWSASCSTGEEALSLAAAAHYYSKSFRKKTSDQTIRVFASDINTLAIDRLREGRYPKSSLRRDGREYHQLVTDHIREENGSTFTVDKGVLPSISIVPLNLYKDSLTEIPDNLDVIFFRNTLIYAPADNRVHFIRKISDKLRVGGYLFVAASEVPYIDLPQLESIEYGDVYLFRRIEFQDHPRETSSVRKPPMAVSQSIPTQVEDRPDLKACIQDTMSAINMENRSKAEAHLIEIDRYYGDTVYAPFLKGLFFRNLGQVDKAREEFLRAVSWEKSFWPASYYLAELYARTDPQRACNEFRQCVHKIDTRRRQGLTDREIELLLLDGFDTSYFYHLCNRWMNKLCTYRGEEYAH